MKKTLSLIVIMLLCIVAAGSPACAKEKAKNEVAVFALTPAPHCNNCVKKIKENMRFEKGIKDISVDLAAKTVTLTYTAGATTTENLVKALKKIGYTAVLCAPEAAPADSKVQR